MDSVPRRWVLKPLSPSLQPSDLRSISAPSDDVFLGDSISIIGGQSSVYVEGYSDSSTDVVVEARQVAVFQDGGSTSEELPISPCSSSSSACSHSGFYSFVEDPFSPEAEKNEAWMVSPQRQMQLSTLKNENSFKLQTYMSHRKPESLFQDESVDSQYEINPKHGYKVVGKEQERQLRKEIIRSQAPKKGPMVNTGEEVDLGDNASRLIEGFSVSYSSVSAKSKPTVDSGAIDQEQINFKAARKQFVQMEQNKLDPIIRPRKINLKMSPNPRKEYIVQEKEVQKEEMTEDVIDAEVKGTHSESHSRQSSLLEDLTYDNLLVNSGESTVDPIQQENESYRSLVEFETPIEREIRISQEREENLRRSRGLQHSVSREMVEIKTKRLQSPLPLTPARVKEKGRVSFIFNEIQKKEDEMREEIDINSFESLQSTDQKKTNIVESDKETTMIKVFETLKEFAIASKFEVLDDLEDESNAENHIGTKEGQEYNKNHIPGTRQELMFEKHVNTMQRDQELPMVGVCEDHGGLEESQYKVSLSRHDLNSGGNWRSPEENGYKRIEERARVDSFNDEVFLLPCCPHKHQEDLVVTKQDSPNVQRPTSPTRSSPSQSWKESLESTGLQGAPSFIEREIEEALRREQELKELREARRSQVYSPQTLVEQADKMAATQFYPHPKTDKLEHGVSSCPHPTKRLSSIPLLSPQPWSPVPLSRPVLHQTSPVSHSSILQSSAAVPQSTSVPQSPVPPALPVLHQSSSVPLSSSVSLSSPLTQSSPGVRAGTLPVRGLTETLLQDFEDRRTKLKLDESAYAGIQPIDSVNNEVVESTRVTRHKNKRALLWEAGEYANLQDD